jgi:hypothetical protein
MARIALVQPYAGLGVYHGDLGIAYIAAHLKGGNHKVDVVDASFSLNDERDASPQGIATEVAEYYPDAVLVKVFGFKYETPAVVIAACREKLPDARYIIGGPTVTVRPEKSMQLTGADIGIAGDGIPTVDYALAGDTSRAGILYRHNGEIHANGIAPFNPDGWPTPDLCAMPDLKHLPLVSSVGCRYGQCTFCIENELYARPSYRSIGKVVEDMKKLRALRDEKLRDSGKPTGMTNFYFYDANFLNNHERLRELAAAMDGEFGDDVKIDFQARADDVIMAERYISNAKRRISRIDIGAESFLASQLRRWKKGVTPEQNAQAFDIVLGNNIHPLLYIIAADAQTDVAEMKAIAEIFTEHPQYLFFGSTFGLYTEYRDDMPSHRCPEYVSTFQRALSKFEAHSHIGMFNNRTRTQAVREGSARCFESEETKRAVRLCFNYLIERAEQVKNNEITPEIADALNKTTILNLTLIGSDSIGV